MVVVLLACQGGGKGGPAGGPEVLSADLVRPAPDAAPLLWHVDLEADRPVTLGVAWTDGAHEVAAAFPDVADVHARHLVGFRAGRTYTVTATVTDADGASTVVAFDPILADDPPPHFPTAEVLVDDPARAPGHTLLPLHSAMAGPPGAADAAVVYDEEGFLCYWLQGDAVYQALLDRGVGIPLFGLVGEGEEAVVGEAAWTGEWVRYWSPLASSLPGVQLVSSGDVGTFHHDAVPLGDGDVLAIARVALPVPAYPVDYVDPLATAPANVSDDLVLRFAPDGQVEAVAAASDLLPLERIGYGSLDLNNADLFDWAHANAVVEDPANGGVIVSFRHQDAVVRFHWDGTGRAVLDWILGNHENWPTAWEPYLLEPEGELEWPFHQHGPEIVSSSADAVTLVLFDNGNYRAVPYGAEPPDPAGQYSRVVQYTIRPRDGTVTQDWAFVDSSVGRLFSTAVGNADLQPGGTVLGAWGFLQGVGGATNGDLGLGAQSIRAIEFDPATLAEVWHLSLTTAAADNPTGWSAYRAHRIPSLYGRVVD